MKEVQVLRLLPEGLASKEVAAALNLAVETVRGYRSRFEAISSPGSRLIYLLGCNAELTAQDRIPYPGRC